jgi:hypothetical protein
MTRKPLSPRQRRIAAAPLGELRRVTFAERIAHPNRFSLGGSYLVPKSVKKITPRTAFITVSRRTDFLAGSPTV